MGYKARNLFIEGGDCLGKALFSNKCFSCPCKTKPPRVFPTGDGKAHCPLPQRRNPLRNRKKPGRLFPLLSTGNASLVESSICFKRWAPEGVQGASGKPPPLVASAEAKPSEKQEKARKAFFLAIHRICITCGKSPFASRGGPPKGSRGRAESPLVASAEAKPSAKQKKQDRLFPLLSTRNLCLVGGFVRLRADEVLSHTGKYPKGAGGGQRVHVSWPPPDPPLLRNSAPLASQGRAQLSSRPSPGGPLSPTRLAFTS